MSRPSLHRPPVIGRALLVACMVAGAAWAADADGVTALPDFLRLREIDQASRAALAEGTGWDDAQEGIAVRVLARLSAPAALTAGWREQAADVAPAGAEQAVADRLVRVRGRATFVAPRALPPALAERAGRTGYDVVRIVDARGAVVDLLVPRAPAAWPRWRPIDEPAEAVGLPLSRGAGPRPSGGPAGAAWPEPRHELLMAATHVAWQPATPLGRLGMDYALFDRVVDGRPLEAADGDAFYALLAAVGRAPAGEIAAAAGPPADTLDLVDPARKWFTEHRGDPVTVEGIVRRATRISIDDPLRAREVGADHYWELYVFVDTPLLDVDGHVQDSYPVVCCVREVPPGMPTGEKIGERVRVSGFGLKRYAYQMEATPAGASGTRRDTALLVGRAVEWRKAPSALGLTSALSWMLVALAAVVMLLLIAGALTDRRADRRGRAALPDRIDLPGDSG